MKCHLTTCFHCKTLYTVIKCLRPFHSFRFYNRRTIISSVTQIIKLQLYNFNNFPLVSKHYSHQPLLKATNYDITSGGETKYLPHYQHCNSTLIHVGEKQSEECKKTQKRPTNALWFHECNMQRTDQRLQLYNEITFIKSKCIC